jgi:hypothetical protein
VDSRSAFLISFISDLVFITSYPENRTMEERRMLANSRRGEPDSIGVPLTELRS